jgi:hypothetical protein
MYCCPQKLTMYPWTTAFGVRMGEKEKGDISCPEERRRVLINLGGRMLFWLECSISFREVHWPNLRDNW